MKYEVTYRSGFDGQERSQTRDTLQEAVAYALILDARTDLRAEVLSIRTLNEGEGK